MMLASVAYAARAWRENAEVVQRQWSAHRCPVRGSEATVAAFLAEQRRAEWAEHLLREALRFGLEECERLRHEVGAARILP